MMNEFDERSLDEEEAMDGLEDPQSELSNMQKEGDLPEAVGSEGTLDSSGSEGLQEEAGVGVKGKLTPEDDEMGSEGSTSHHQRYSHLQQLYTDKHYSVFQGDSQPNGSADEEENEGEDKLEVDHEWKKTIMVGPDFQAAIPDGLCQYDDALPYQNEDKLLWEPSPLTDKQALDFLVKAQEPPSNGQQGGVFSIPTGSHVRDDEQALHLLLQCGFNTDEAVRRRHMNLTTTTDSMSLWSEEECRNFESGLRDYGKDFHLIQQHKVRTRSVGELVQFYYLWKKTERHDVFANKGRLEKKKYALHPGITDYMDRLLDDQECASPSRDRSLSPSTHTLNPKQRGQDPGSETSSSARTLLPSIHSSGVSICADRGADNFMRSPNVRKISICSDVTEDDSEHTGL